MSNSTKPFYAIFDWRFKRDFEKSIQLDTAATIEEARAACREVGGSYIVLITPDTGGCEIVEGPCSH